jgi:hypothetical protein
MTFYTPFVHFSSDSNKTRHIIHKNVFNDSEFVNIGAVIAMLCLRASYFLGEIGYKISEQTTLIQFNTTLVYFNTTGYLYISATCFGLYLGHPQACQYKNHTKEDK